MNKEMQKHTVLFSWLQRLGGAGAGTTDNCFAFAIVKIYLAILHITKRCKFPNKYKSYKAKYLQQKHCIARSSSCTTVQYSVVQ